MAKRELYNMDCMKYMRGLPDNSFELAIVDPPYFDGPQKIGYFGGGFSSLGVVRESHYHPGKCWDVPPPEYFKELSRVSVNQIIWGANHFAGSFNSSGPGWIVWDKVNGGSSFADCELAYTSFASAVRIFRFMWNGMMQGLSISQGHIQQGNKKLNEKRIHPTQKPVKLYEWLLKNYAKEGDRILDTHLGSGSSAIAAHYAGYDFVGTELDEDYFKAAEKRIDQKTSQLSLFKP